MESGGHVKSQLQTNHTLNLQRPCILFSLLLPRDNLTSKVSGWALFLMLPGKQCPRARSADSQSGPHGCPKLEGR